MPRTLEKPMKPLDKAVDSVSSDKPLKSEEERQKVLLEAYEEMTKREKKLTLKYRFYLF